MISVIFSSSRSFFFLSALARPRIFLPTLAACRAVLRAYPLSAARKTKNLLIQATRVVSFLGRATGKRFKIVAGNRATGRSDAQSSYRDNKSVLHAANSALDGNVGVLFRNPVLGDRGGHTLGLFVACLSSTVVLRRMCGCQRCNRGRLLSFVCFAFIVKVSHPRYSVPAGRLRRASAGGWCQERGRRPKAQTPPETTSALWESKTGVDEWSRPDSGDTSLLPPGTCKQCHAMPLPPPSSAPSATAKDEQTLVARLWRKIRISIGEQALWTGARLHPFCAAGKPAAADAATLIAIAAGIPATPFANTIPLGRGGSGQPVVSRSQSRT